MISVGSILHETYRIDEELGRGGMGCVFAATHMRLPRRVAVKVLMKPTDGQALKRFRREAEICSQIGHESIVEVFDFNEVDGQPYIVMELLLGESLRQRLDREPRLPRPTLIQLVREVGKALAAAHAVDVVHRDLKPANLFICKAKGEGTEQLKILDFGISKILGMLSLQTRDDHLLGTPGYMSPEQARGDVQSVNAKADQFSLATIVYEALSGQPAFVSEGDTPYTVLYKIVHRDPPPLTDQPPELRAVLARAMAKDPAARYADVSEMSEALLAALARVPDTRPYAPLRQARRRWPLLVTAALVAASVGVGAVVLQRERRRAAEAAAPVRPSPAPLPTTNAPSAPAEAARPAVKAEATVPAAHVEPPAKAPPLKSGARPTSRPAPPRPPKSKAPGDDDELSNPYRETP